MHIIKSKSAKILVLSLIFLSSFSVLEAENVFFFTTNLYWNSPAGSEDVKELQRFLTKEGVYTGPITGNFMHLTQKGVKDFQIKEGITPTLGYFGPTTRRKANSIISGSSKKASLTAIQTKVTDLFDEVWSMQGKINQNGETGNPGTPITTLTPIPTNVTVPTPATPTPATTPTTPPPVTSTPAPTPTPVPIVIPTPPTPTITPPPPIVIVPTPAPVPVPTVASASTSKMEWGAYVGDSSANLNTFESLVGEQADIRSVFYGFDDGFPMHYSSSIGAQGKKLLLFWESSFGYDTIINGSKDGVIKKFAQDAKTYGYPVILSPFHEMNGNWSPWSGTLNNNTPAKFIAAWRHIHALFKDAPNVKFALVYNSVSVPNVVGNQFSDYYPGSEYVDYVGLDGFNFGTPWLTFKAIFDAPLKKMTVYNKPIYIFSMGSVPGPAKAEWIKDALGVQIHNYPIVGWVWFNQNGHDGNWLVNSDPASLEAFKNVIPN